MNSGLKALLKADPGRVKDKREKVQEGNLAYEIAWMQSEPKRPMCLTQPQPGIDADSDHLYVGD
jgi:hypothetical protein